MVLSHSVAYPGADARFRHSPRVSTSDHRRPAAARASLLGVYVNLTYDVINLYNDAVY